MARTESMPISEVEEVRWYVMRAYKNEKLAEMRLSESAGLPFFIAKEETTRVYHGKKFVKSVPVIPSIIFVHASRQAIQQFKNRNPYLQYAMIGTAFMTVPDKQMDDFIRLSSAPDASPTYLLPNKFAELQKGAQVRIHGGALDGVVGTYVETVGSTNPRVLVIVGNLLGITAEVHPDLIQAL